ncbi:hypothetical protein GCM10010195_45010 [Kitasatospora griseola]|nr:hypothetical protein GCM10010195_45010 [Kitasatospora griseola]
MGAVGDHRHAGVPDRMGKARQKLKRATLDTAGWPCGGRRDQRRARTTGPALRMRQVT